MRREISEEEIGSFSGTIESIKIRPDGCVLFLNEHPEHFFLSFRKEYFLRTAMNCAVEMVRNRQVLLSVFLKGNLILKINNIEVASIEDLLQGIGNKLDVE